MDFERLFDAQPHIGSYVMKCPRCESTYLRHDEAPVDIWQRGEDSSSDGYSILPGGRGIEAIPGQENPSARRSGLRLHLSCESCGTAFGLTISQHKGETFLKIEHDDTNTSD